MKTTQKALTKKDRRLRVGMTAGDVRRATQVLGPTYLIGIDERTEIAYIVPILHGMKNAIHSISTQFPLDATNLPLLHAEVIQFWATRDMKRLTSVFST